MNGSGLPPDTDLDLDTLLEFCAQELSQEMPGRAYLTAAGTSDPTMSAAQASSQGSAYWAQGPLPFVPMTGHPSHPGDANLGLGLSNPFSGWLDGGSVSTSTAFGLTSQPDLTPVIPSQPAVSAAPALTAVSKRGSQGDGSSSDEKERGRGANGAIDHREKNKRAQRRFRERQKARLAESEQRASDLAAELAKVKMERSMLESRNAILEKILELRGGTSGALPAAGGANPNGPGSGPNGTVRSQHGSRSDLSTLVKQEDGGESAKILTLTVREGETLQISLEQMRSLPRTEVSRLWKEYVNAFAACLVDANGQPDSPRTQRIRQLLDELMSVTTCFASVNPKGWISLRCMRLEEGAAAGEAEPTCEMWMSIMRAMNLSPEQKAKMLQLRRFYLTRLANILRQRQEVSMALLRTLPGYTQRTARNMIAAGHLKSLETFEQLKANLAAEQECIQQFAAAVRSIITPYQIAIAIVQSYPWTPDSLAICNCLAKAESDAPLESLFNLSTAPADKAAVLAATTGPTGPAIVTTTAPMDAFIAITQAQAS